VQYSEAMKYNKVQQSTTKYNKVQQKSNKVQQSTTKYNKVQHEHSTVRLTSMDWGLAGGGRPPRHLSLLVNQELHKKEE